MIERLHGRWRLHWMMLAVVLIAGLSAPTWATEGSSEGLVDPEKMPGPLKEVRFDQHLGKTLPLDLRFVDDTGRDVVLGSLFGERPVVLAFVYYECPMLCSLIMNGVAKSLGVLKLDVGEDFDVVAVSFDPGETPEMAAEVKTKTVDRYDRPETADGWHFLTGDEASIRRLTEAAGFSYVYDPDTDEFAHASGIVIVRPDGIINQYYLGIEYPPKDVRLALVDAGDGKVGSLVDQLLLYCFRYDPALGKYTAAIMRVLRLAGFVFSVGLATFLFVMWRRERRLTERRLPTVGAA